MTAPATEYEDGEQAETIKLPANGVVQRALHEATGHVYDELAMEYVDAEEEELPTEVFAALEEFYVATAEESVTGVRISYNREQEP